MIAAFKASTWRRGGFGPEVEAVGAAEFEAGAVDEEAVVVGLFCKRELR